MELIPKYWLVIAMVSNEKLPSLEKKTEFLQIRVSPKIKRKIEQYIEEKGFNTISSFVLFCIDHYMNFGEKIDEILRIVEQLNKE